MHANSQEVDGKAEKLVAGSVVAVHADELWVAVAVGEVEPNIRTERSARYVRQ